MLKFHVQDQLHRTIREFSDDTDNSFLNICRALRHRIRYLDIVDPYADAMWNYIQLDSLKVDIMRELDSGWLSEKQRLVVEKVLSAVLEARSVSGYVLIVGD
jgi:hypothetical protein